MKLVTTHERCCRLPNSPVMRGRAVATMFWSSAASVSANMRPLSANRSSRADVSEWIAPTVDMDGVRAPPVVALESVFASFMNGVPLARNDMDTHAKRTAARQPLTKRSLCDTDASLYARLASHILVE